MRYLKTFENHSNDSITENKFNESVDNLSSFYNEYKELCDHDDLGNHELWMEIGQLTLKHGLSKEDVKNILDNYDCSFDINRFLLSTYNSWETDLTAEIGETNYGRRTLLITHEGDNVRLTIRNDGKEVDIIVNKEQLKSHL